jgi:hypothetical protein
MPPGLASVVDGGVSSNKPSKVKCRTAAPLVFPGSLQSMVTMPPCTALSRGSASLPRRGAWASQSKA